MTDSEMTIEKYFPRSWGYFQRLKAEGTFRTVGGGVQLIDNISD